MISKKNKIMIAVFMMAGFIGSLSQNLLASALPTIMKAFSVDLASAQWLTTLYILILGIITAMSAFVFYRFPTKKMSLFSLSVFLIGCIMAFLTHSFPVLLIARAIQAIGAGILIPMLQIVVMYVYPQDKQGQALALTGIIVGFAPAIAPTLAGVLIDHLGWRSIFLFLIIFTIVILILGIFFFEEIGERRQEKMDYLSLVLYGIGFVSIMLAITFMKNGTLLSLTTISLFIIGIIGLTLFTKRQFHISTPLLKLSLVKYSSLVYGTVLLCISFVAMMSASTLVPVFIQSVAHHTATLSGMIMLPGSLIIALLSPLSGKLCDTISSRKVVFMGMIFLLIGNVPFLFFDPSSSVLLIMLSYGIRGIGLALLITACTTLSVEDLSLEDKPYGTAILNSLRQMSGSLFSTLLVIIATLSSATSTIDASGIHSSFFYMTLIIAAGLVIAGHLIKAQKQ